MIRYLRNDRIDRTRYDACVLRSPSTRIYACSWYLDRVTDHWDALVKGDYEAVMPLATRRKYGISYIYPPPWTQQLGVFGSGEEPELIKEFLRAIPKRFLLVEYMLGSEAPIDARGLIRRPNYTLSLTAMRPVLETGFNKNRKRIVRKGFEGLRLDQKGDRKALLQLYRQIEFDFPVHKDAFEKLERLLDPPHPAINVWNVYEGEELLGGLVWLLDERRITFLLPVTTSEARSLNVPSFLVLSLIDQYQGTGLLLDFEGSGDPGVARFYKSFGAVEEGYYFYKRKLFAHV